MSPSEAQLAVFRIGLWTVVWTLAGAIGCGTPVESPYVAQSQTSIERVVPEPLEIGVVGEWRSAVDAVSW